MGYSLITGGTGVLGKEVVKTALLRKEKLILTGRNLAKLNLLKEELLVEYENAEVLTFVVNLENEVERKDFFKLCENKGYKFSALYYVAGADIQKAFTKYDSDSINFQIRSILEGSVDFCNFAYKNRDNKIKMLIVSSLTGFTAMPYFSLYSAVKGAQISFFKAFKKEVSKNDCYITILAPGSIPTREDIKLDIKKQGLQGKLSSKPKEFIVKKAFKALDKNKTVCIPGFYNKLVYFVSKLTPESIKLSIISKKFKNKEKDAFF